MANFTRNESVKNITDNSTLPSNLTILASLPPQMEGDKWFNFILFGVILGTLVVLGLIGNILNFVVLR